MATNQKLCILVVDDDAAFLRTITAILSADVSFVVTGVSSGEEALALVSDGDFHVILLDIGLGEGKMDGIECCDRLRKNGFEGFIFMISGDIHSDTLAKAAMAGADDYLVKGDTGDFAGEVRRLISMSIDRAIRGEDISHVSEGAFLRTRRLDPAQAKLLSEYVKNGFPSGKEFADKLGVSESSLWKRLERIRNKLSMDSLSELVHMLSHLKIFDFALRKTPTNIYMKTSKTGTQTKKQP